MKRMLIAACAALAIRGVAHATDFTCHLTDQRGNALDYTFRPEPGFMNVEELGFMRNGQNANYNHTPLWRAFNDPNVGGTTLTSNDDPGWAIAYPTAPGNTNKATLWHNHYGRSNVVAVGSCYDVPTVATAPAYNPAPAPAAVPAYNYSPPAAVASAGEDSIGLINVGKGMMAQVTLGSQPVTMIVDTGASDMLIPAKVADRLVASGEAIYNSDNATIQQADGNSVSERTITIHSMTIGRHTLHEVTASVAEGQDAMGLLPYPVLSRAGRFTIDAINNKLIFG